MARVRLIAFILVGLCVAVIGFNNCSKVEFSKATELPSVAGAQGEDDAGTPPTQDDIDNVNNLPPEIKDTPIPVSEITQDPTLIDKFRCGDGGVLICHFPNGWDDQHSQCIGESAVKSHFDHIREELGLDRPFYDYLGNCRFTIDQFPAAE
jgi:hypothetical protein